MLRFLLAVIFIFSLCFCIKAQKDSVYYGTTDPTVARKKERNDEWKERVTYGGNFQAFFGNPTYIYLSPSIGYNLLDDLNVGVGVIYNYASINYGSGRLSQSIFGGHSYARYTFTQYFFLQGQFDRLLQPNVYNYSKPNEKVWVDYALVGAGYRQPLGSKAFFITSLMYNLTPHRLSIYPSPFIFQVGIIASFK